MATLEDTNALLIYRVGPVYCCAPTLPVDAIIQPPALTHPPGVTAASPGIFKYGADVVRTVDLRYLFGVEDAEWNRPGRVVVTHLGSRHIGFWVDDIIDVIELPASGWGRLNAALTGGYFTRTLLLDSVIHLYTEFEKLLEIKQAGFLKPYLKTLQQEQDHKPGTKAESVSIGSKTSTNMRANAANQLDSAAEPPRHPETTLKAPTPIPVSGQEQARQQRPRQTAKLQDKAESLEKPVIKKNADTAGNSASTAHGRRIQQGMEDKPTSLTAMASPRVTALRPQNHDGKSPNDPVAEHKARHTTRLDAATKPRSMATDASSKLSQTLNANASAMANDRLNANTQAQQKYPSLQPEERLEKPSTPTSATASLTPNRQNGANDRAKLSNRPAAFENRLASSENTNPTVAAQAPLSRVDNEPETNAWLGVIFFLVVILSIVGVGYLFWPDEEIKRENKTASYRPSTPAEVIQPSYSEQQASTEYELEDTESVAALSTPIEEPISAQPRETNGEIAQAPLPEKSGENESAQMQPTLAEPDSASQSDVFHAIIEKNSDEVTIVLTAPEDEPVWRQQKELAGKDVNTEENKINTPQTALEVKAVQQNSTMSADEQAKSADKEIKPNNNSTPYRREIIHRVVKGDTLWHIAERYIHNPFRYPELARLNQIKNPDLIYPGNRVRIILIKKNKASESQHKK